MNPAKRTGIVTECTRDQRSPGELHLRVQKQAPLVERDPVQFWKVLSAFLALTVVVLVFVIARGRARIWPDLRGKGAQPT